MGNAKKARHDIFIGYYRRTGIDFARQLKEGLKDFGYLAFLDIYDISSSVKENFDEWHICRDESLINSDRLLLIMTIGFNTRAEVLHEIELAKEKGIEILYFKHEDLPYDSDDLEVIVKGEKINLSKYPLNSFTNGPDLLRKTIKILEKPDHPLIVESVFEDIVNKYVESEGNDIRRLGKAMIEIIIGSTNNIMNWLPPNEENEAIVRASPYCLGNIISWRYYYEIETLPRDFFRVHINGYFHFITLLEIETDDFLPIDYLIYDVLELLIYCIRVMKKKMISTNQSIYIKFRNMQNIKLKFDRGTIRPRYFPSDELEPYIKQFNPEDEWPSFKKVFNMIYREICIDLAYPTITDLTINRRLYRILRRMKGIHTFYSSIPNVELKELGFTEEEMK